LVVGCYLAGSGWSYLAGRMLPCSSGAPLFVGCNLVSRMLPCWSDATMLDGLVFSITLETSLCVVNWMPTLHVGCHLARWMLSCSSGSSLFMGCYLIRRTLPCSSDATLLVGLDFLITLGTSLCVVSRMPTLLVRWYLARRMLPCSSDATLLVGCYLARRA
jgi:hypothetical protein